MTARVSQELTEIFITPDPSALVTQEFVETFAYPDERNIRISQNMVEIWYILSPTSSEIYGPRVQMM